MSSNKEDSLILGLTLSILLFCKFKNRRSFEKKNVHQSKTSIFLFFIYFSQTYTTKMREGLMLFLQLVKPEFKIFRVRWHFFFSTYLLCICENLIFILKNYLEKNNYNSFLQIKKNENIFAKVNLRLSTLIDVITTLN